MRLNGWQRLWVVAAVAWAIVVVVAVYVLWPMRRHTDAPRSAILDSRQTLDGPRKPVASVDYDALAREYGGKPSTNLPDGWKVVGQNDRTATANGVLALTVADFEYLAEMLTAADQDIRSDGISLEKKLTPDERRRFMEYQEGERRALNHARAMFAGVSLGAWALPIGTAYALGWSIGWIRRGFANNDSAV